MKNSSKGGISDARSFPWSAACSVLGIDLSVLLYGSEKKDDSSSFTDKEKAVIRILRSGTKEENEQELSLFISLVRSVRGRNPCWKWNSIQGKFCHYTPTDDDFDNEDSDGEEESGEGSVTGAI